MIALILALQAAPAAPVPGTLARQALPAQGCAAYLWSRADRRLVAMATGDPAQLRLSLDGRQADLARESQSGAGPFGLPDRAAYRAGDVAATLEMTIEPRGDLTDGAIVPEGTLTLTRGSGDAAIVPVAGLIGCKPANGVETRRGSVR